MTQKELDIKMKQTVNCYLQSNISYLKGKRTFENAVLINNFNSAFYSLTDKERRFIENEYISNSNRGWRNKYYSRSTYYSLKSGIINKFFNKYEQYDHENNKENIFSSF